MTNELDCAPRTHPAVDRVRYLTASGVALWGAQILQIAVPLVAVTALHAGAGGTSLLTIVLTVPFVALGLPVGAWLDRVRRRPVMIAADLVRAAILLTVPVAYWMDHLTMAQLLVVTLGLGIGAVFFDLGTQSLIKDVVGAEDLVRTNGRLATITQTALICAPPLAGWAAGLTSAPAVLTFTALGYVVSAACLSRVRVLEHQQPAQPRRRLLLEMREGVDFVWRQPVLRAVVLAGSLVNVAAAAVTTLLPVLALSALGWTERTLGAFLGAGGVGGLLGALTAARVARRIGAGRAVLLVGIAVAPLALTQPWLGDPVPGPVAAVGWALVVYKVGFDAVLMTSFRQQVTPAGLLGRVNGTMRMLFTGAITVGAATAGLIAGAVGLRTALGLAAVALACVWIPIARSPIRHMITLDE